MTKSPPFQRTFCPARQKFILGNDNSATHLEGRKILATHQCIGAVESDAHDLSHVRHGQHDGQFIVVCIDGFLHSFVLSPSRGKDFNLLSFVLVIHFLTIIWRGVLRQLPAHGHGRAANRMVILFMTHGDALALQLAAELLISLHSRR